MEDRTPTQISRDDALAALQQERDARIRACNEDIQSVLSKYKCTLRAVPTIRDGRVEADIHLLTAD